MESRALYAPWRMDYIRSLGKNEFKENGKCFLCQAAESDESNARDRLMLWKTDQVVVLINRYPYANGHLLVAPRAHKADLEQLTEDEQAHLSRETANAVKLLKKAVSAQGFNIGINLGRVAGAGVPGHLHQHIVPRWGGDTNFMHVVAETSIIPEANLRLYEELMRIKF